MDRPIKFGSVCSGIEAASVAWMPLGWRAAWLSEIEPFPSAVLAHHYPDVPNLGDMTALPERIRSGEIEAPDIFCGGTPCQAFSVAGLRNSLTDERGGLTLKFVEIANAIDHVRAGRGDDECVVFWENVPGVLNTRDNAFGSLLAGLAGESESLEPPRGKWTNAGAVFGPQRAVAWRVLDAQYFGVAQRRRRVFVVASARKGFDPAAVLFEFEGLRRDTAPRREAREVAPTIPSRSTAGGGLGTDFDCDGGTICVATGQAGAEIGADMAPTLNCNHEAPYVVRTLRGEGFDASGDGTGRGTPWVPVVSGTLGANHGNIRADHAWTGQLVATAIRTANTSANGHGISPELARTLDRAQGQCVAFDTTQITSPANVSNPKHGDPCHPLAAGAHAPAIAFDSRQDPVSSEEVFGALGCASPQAQAVAYAIQAGALRVNPASGPDGLGVQPEHAYTLEARAEVQAVATATKVRRLTPEECEALQGFPRGYTAIAWRGKPADQCPDGPRYKSLGNSWPVPVVTWIGRRMARHMGPRDA